MEILQDSMKSLRNIKIFIIQNNLIFNRIMNKNLISYGVKVNANNFGQHNQVFYLYCVGTSGSIKDASAEGLVLNFN